MQERFKWSLVRKERFKWSLVGEEHSLSKQERFKYTVVWIGRKDLNGVQ